ncbi:MAG TPA: EamA/RhaT family transporter [Rhodobacteraceae bacterium]|jgi:drug/metabolite transporter (DMT)-like permease|nr:EamA/RhaT family transporter [Paracoccaceae bacterium]
MPLAQTPSAVRGFAFGLGAFGLWAIHDVVIKSLGPVMPVWQMMFFLNLFWLPCIVVLLIIDTEPGSLRPVNPRLLMLRSVLSICVSLPIFFAFTQLKLAETYSILFSTPLWITALSMPLLGERVGPRRWAAVIVGFIGVLIVLRPGLSPIAIGHVSAMIGAFFAAVVFLIMRRLGRDERTGVLMLYPVLTNLLILPFFLIFLGFEPMTLPNLGATALMAFLGFAGTVCIITAYRYADAAMVAPSQYSQILWATGFGILLFGETPGWNVALGGLIIVGSGAYITWREHQLSKRP